MVVEIPLGKYGTSSIVVFTRHDTRYWGFRNQTDFRLHTFDRPETIIVRVYFLFPHNLRGHGLGIVPRGVFAPFFSATVVPLLGSMQPMSREAAMWSFVGDLQLDPR